MEITKAGPRGHVFTFPDLSPDGFPHSNVLVLDAGGVRITCDTFLGPGFMARVHGTSDIFKNGARCHVAFNSHADFDHHWGNCWAGFRGAPLVAHRLTREAILARGEAEMEEFSRFKGVDVAVTPPDVTFEEKMVLHELGIEFFHSPGHTIDSSSCIDVTGGVLFAGDNIEAPVPYLTSRDVEGYITTLEGYIAMEPGLVVPGHGPATAGMVLVRDNIDYLHFLLDGDLDRAAAMATGAGPVHEHNLAVMSPGPGRG